MPESLSRLFAVAGGLLLLAVVTCAFLARMQAQELRSIEFGSLTWYVFYGSVVATALVWTVAGVRGRELLRRINTQALTTIALISGLQCVMLYASRVVFALLSAVTGPLSVYVTDIVDKGCLGILSAILIVLLPRPGTITLSLIAVSLVNAVLMGSIGINSLIFISATVVLHEGWLAACGVTVGPSLRRPAVRPSAGVLARMAVALGGAGGCVLIVHYTLYRVLFRFEFSDWYVISVTLLNGCVYGAVGAVIGTLMGYRLRRTAP